jgi:hypothetical protein
LFVKQTRQQSQCFFQLAGANPLLKPAMKGLKRRVLLRDNPVCRAMEWFATPWLANRMTWHLRTVFCAVAPVRSKDSS